MAMMAAIFQSTHPRGVRLILKRLLERLPNFNPRTHVGCDARSGEYRRISGISIHAPTWGATKRYQNDWSLRIFQSTHPRGVRLRLQTQLSTQRVFQSTHPRGVRQSPCRCPSLPRPISIHAPTWGATPWVVVWIISGEFQSTHPRGVRRYQQRGTRDDTQYFNPRTHVGCDSRPRQTRLGRWISIHAPTWGATFRKGTNSVEDFNFNPRTHVGCDLKLGDINGDDIYFNPRTHVGCDTEIERAWAAH